MWGCDFYEFLEFTIYSYMQVDRNNVLTFCYASRLAIKTQSPRNAKDPNLQLLYIIVSHSGQKHVPNQVEMSTFWQARVKNIVQCELPFTLIRDQSA